MRTGVVGILAALASLLLALSACTSDGAESVVVTVTTTVPASSASSSTTSSSTTSSHAAAAPTAPPVDDCGAVGITGAPGSESPHCLGTQIASCGSSIHETGTTFFTDGTSGWTQTCADQMLATYVPPAPSTFDQDAYNEQFADEYWRTHPTPTFNPDSADGFGPDQELPPACLRLEGVDC